MTAKTAAVPANVPVVMKALAFMLAIYPAFRDYETSRRRALKADAKGHIPADRVWNWIHPTYDKCGLAGHPNTASLWDKAVRSGLIEGVSIDAATDKPTIGVYTLLAMLKDGEALAFNRRSGRYTSLDDAAKYAQEKTAKDGGNGDLLALLTGKAAAVVPSIL